MGAVGVVVRGGSSRSVGVPRAEAAKSTACICIVDVAEGVGVAGAACAGAACAVGASTACICIVDVAPAVGMGWAW